MAPRAGLFILLVLTFPLEKRDADVRRVMEVDTLLALVTRFPMRRLTRVGLGGWGGGGSSSSGGLFQFLRLLVTGRTLSPTP
jgi:hypothetical protein